MKTKIPALTLIASVALLFAGTGCNTISKTTTPYVGVPQFPPTNPANVQILRVEPTRPNIRLGEIRLEPYSENIDVTKIDAALKQQAAKLGADAAVVVLDRVQTVGAMVVGGWLNRSVETIQGLVVVAIAIKYQ